MIYEPSVSSVPTVSVLRAKRDRETIYCIELHICRYCYHMTFLSPPGSAAACNRGKSVEREEIFSSKKYETYSWFVRKYMLPGVVGYWCPYLITCAAQVSVDFVMTERAAISLINQNFVFHNEWKMRNTPPLIKDMNRFLFCKFNV